mmetsp:Transcript_9897/g.19456  ORF Transcript_9897/g.19456 Transcript_9897/m.19456 type:complete len:556 (+) Transcript_9897:213-1880(+)
MVTYTECAVGIADCKSPSFSSDDAAVCARYDQEYLQPDKMLWLLILAGIFMALMAFGIGANDAANSWSTSVGSGAISLKYAVAMGGVAELLGAVTLGYGVSSKIQKGVAEITDEEGWACGYCDSDMSVYSVGMFGALVGASLFLLIATFTSMPVSTTHAIVGGVVGMTMAAIGVDYLNWDFDGGLGGIVASWVISPVLSGMIGMAMFFVTKLLIFDRPRPDRNAVLAIPVLYSLVTAVMVYLIMIKSQVTKDLVDDEDADGLQLTTTAIMTALAFVVSTFGVVPFVQSRLPSKVGVGGVGSSKGEESNGIRLVASNLTHAQFEAMKAEGESKGDTTGGAPVKTIDDNDDGQDGGKGAVLTQEQEQGTKVSELALDDYMVNTPEKRDAMFCFRYLLVFNAVLESFAHGANDTANATAPFTAVWNGYDSGLYSCESKETPPWIMALAGSFVALGMVTAGKRVIETIGTKLTAIDFHKGFCVEFASTATVVIATLLEVPVSTTHCQIGAVTFVGLAAYGTKGVSIPLVMQIFISWVLTLPFAGGIAAAMMALLRQAAL